ncbi:MAG: metal ABC transporter permease [Lachnospiraceae bacterium]|nr:metal ABC transporter permease [Lachnospiraceae bacterium]
MNEIIETLSIYLKLEFVQYAIIVGILIALCSSLIGVILVLKSYSFIGDSLSHVAFLMTSIAMIIELTNDMYLTLPITILCSLFLFAFNKRKAMSGDAMLALIAVSSLAFGYLLMNIFASASRPNLSADVCATLFGATSILTLKQQEVWFCIGLSIIVVVFFVLFYNRIFCITFDEDFTKASGLNANFYNILISLIIGIIIVVSMKLVGSLLISALIIFPALISMKVMKSFKSVVICSVIVSIIGVVLGLFISIVASTPVGSTIVAVDIGVYIIFSIIGAIIR